LPLKISKRMRRVDQLLRQDKGQALVIALGVMAVLAATAAIRVAWQRLDTAGSEGRAQVRALELRERVIE